MSRWKRVLCLLVIPALFLATGLLTIHDRAETWDEWFDKAIGVAYVDDWPKTGAKGIEKRFGILQRNYGPFFDVLTVQTHRLVNERLGWLKDPVASYHLATLLASSAGLFLLAFLGARLLGPGTGFVAALLLALMPQWVAHSQNNLKDMPLAVFFTLGIVVFVEAVRRDRTVWFLLGGVVAGLTWAIKVHGAFLFPIAFLWVLLSERFSFRRLAVLSVRLCASGVVAFVTVLGAWPYYRHEPLTRFAETIRIFADHEYNELVFYLGRHIPAHDVPWHFPFVMLGVNTPLAHLFFVAVGTGLLLRVALDRSRSEERTKDHSALVLLLVWFFFPLLIQIASRGVKLDGVRHFLLVMPPLALLAACGVVRTFEAVASRRALRPLRRVFLGTVLALPFGLVLWKMIEIHPYQVVFFNQLAGGIRGARERFELDYWGISLTPVARWLNENAPRGSRVWLTIPGPHFFYVDSGRLTVVFGMTDRPTYKVNLVRGLLRRWDTEDDYLHPRRRPVYAVTVDGANLVEVFEFPENAPLGPGVVIPPGKPPSAAHRNDLRHLRWGNGRFTRSGVPREPGGGPATAASRGEGERP